jgi:hypothetical protein
LFGGVNHEPIVYIDRVKTTPLTIAGHPVKVAWLIFSGSLGAVGSVASIWSAWATTHPYFWIILFGFSGMALLLGLQLSRQRFSRFPPFFNLESSKTGEIYLTKVEGECPKCNGTLKLREVGPKGYRITLVCCTRNPDHKWRFDPTVLEDI